MLRFLLIVFTLTLQAFVPAFGAGQADPSQLTLDEAQGCREDIEASHRFWIESRKEIFEKIRTDPAGAAQAWIGIEVGKLEGSSRIHGMLADTCLANLRLLKMQKVYGPTGMRGRSTVLSAADLRQACGGGMKEEALEQINNSTREWIKSSRESIKRGAKGDITFCAYRARLALIDAAAAGAPSKAPGSGKPATPR